MYKFLKKLWHRYIEFTMEQYAERPKIRPKKIYKVGNKKFVRTKRLTRGPIPKTRYEK